MHEGFVFGLLLPVHECSTLRATSDISRDCWSGCCNLKKAVRFCTVVLGTKSQTFKMKDTVIMIQNSLPFMPHFSAAESVLLYLFILLPKGIAVFMDEDESMLALGKPC